MLTEPGFRVPGGGPASSAFVFMYEQVLNNNQLFLCKAVEEGKDKNSSVVVIEEPSWPGLPCSQALLLRAVHGLTWVLPWDFI